MSTPPAREATVHGPFIDESCMSAATGGSGAWGRKEDGHSWPVGRFWFRDMFSYRKLLGPRKLEEILRHAVEQPGPQNHVGEVAAEVKGDAVDHHQLDRRVCRDLHKPPAFIRGSASMRRTGLGTGGTHHRARQRARERKETERQRRRARENERKKRE